VQVPASTGEGRGTAQQGASRADASAHAKRRGAASPKDQPHPRHRRQTPHRQFAERVSPTKAFTAIRMQLSMQ